MKSFFNSLYTITKAPKKLKAIRNAVDLAMDLLLSSQDRKHRRKHKLPDMFGQVP